MKVDSKIPKSHCDWALDNFIKDSMTQVFNVTRSRYYHRFGTDFSNEKKWLVSFRLQ